MYLKGIFGHTSKPKVHHAACSGADTDLSDFVRSAELGRSIRSHDAHHPYAQKTQSGSRDSGKPMLHRCEPREVLYLVSGIKEE